MGDRLGGKVGVITGGARGMWESHVRRFVAEGVMVVFTDILDGERKALQKALGEAALFIHDSPPFR